MPASEASTSGEAADAGIAAAAGHLEASTSSEGVEGEWVASGLSFPEVPSSTGRTAEAAYLALGLGHLAAAGAVAYSALQAPQLLLPAAAASDPWAAALLGCLAVTYLRGAGVFLHLKHAAANGELLCWRHQRLAALAALSAVIAAATQAFGAASPQLAGLQALLAVASAGAVFTVGRSVLSTAPFVSWVLLESGGSAGGLAAALGRQAAAAVSTVAGVLLLAAAGVSLYGFVHTALAAAPATPALLGGWPGAPQAGLAGLAGWAVGLRRLAGAGLLLVAALAGALLDFATEVRRPPAPDELDAVKGEMLRTLYRSKDPAAKYFLPSPATYTHLNIAFLAAAALQAFFVATAPAAGVNVNWDGALWGPMYGSWILGLSYGASVLLTFDWQSVGALLYGGLFWASSLVLSFFNALPI